MSFVVFTLRVNRVKPVRFFTQQGKSFIRDREVLRPAGVKADEFIKKTFEGENNQKKGAV